MISVVIPVKNEQENVRPLHERIVAALQPLGEPYEIIFVDDGSTDRTVPVLKTLPKVRLLILSMDFGQTSALDAGIHDAQGDIIVTMDGDLQNDPADIPKLVAKIREGYDVVSGWRQDRHDSSWRKIFSRLANWLTAKVSGLALHDNACALKAYRRETVTSVRLYGDMHVFLPAYLHSQGARVTEMPVIHHERKFGVSKFYLARVVKDIFDLMTVKFLITIKGRPLLLFGGVGALSIIFGFVVAALAVYLKIAGIRDFTRTPLPVLSVFFVLSGLLFFMMGFLAELILRVYFETNKKAPYVIRERRENP